MFSRIPMPRAYGPWKTYGPTGRVCRRPLRAHTLGWRAASRLRQPAWVVQNSCIKLLRGGKVDRRASKAARAARWPVGLLGPGALVLQKRELFSPSLWRRRHFSNRAALRLQLHRSLAEAEQQPIPRILFKKGGEASLPPPTPRTPWV